MLSCRKTTQLLSERQDRPLQIGEKLSLSLHTGMCSACRRFGQQMTLLSDLSKQYRQYQIPKPHDANAPSLGLMKPSADQE